MRAGKMRHRVTFQRRQSGKDAYGKENGPYADLATIWAEVEPLTGREFFASLQVQSEKAIRVRCRWQQKLSDLTTKDRAAFNGRLFDIQSTINVLERNVELQIMCIEHSRET